jgi:predicted RNA binding protein YcfA (HicA-like mRNA interferase family)
MFGARVRRTRQLSALRKFPDTVAARARNSTWEDDDERSSNQARPSFWGVPSTIRSEVLAKGRRALPRILSQSKAQALLERYGWVRTLGGRHVVKMEKEGHRPITLPQHHGRDYSADLSDRILRQAGLKGGPGSDER